MNILIIALGAYMLAVGIIGYVRTSSPTALYINGGIAIITMILGYIVGAGSEMALKVAACWVGLITVMLGFMTFKRIIAHGQVRRGSKFIFGSMAIFAAIVFIVLMKTLV